MVEIEKKKLRPITEFVESDEINDLRLGRYHQSNWWNIPSYGFKRWVVCGYLEDLEVDVDALLQGGTTEKQITEQCIEFLNQVDFVQSTKKRTKSRYGNLEFYQCNIKKNKNNETFIEVLMITDEKNNKCFWASGADPVSL